MEKEQAIKAEALSYEADIISAMFEVIGKKFDAKTQFEFLREVVEIVEKRRKEEFLSMSQFLRKENPGNMGGLKITEE